MNKKRKLNLYINTESLQNNYKNYNYRIRYYRRKFNYNYYNNYIEWWGKCKLCKINTNKKHNYYYYCKDCLPNNNNKIKIIK